MKVRIEFEVKDEEEFERLGDAFKLPNETWTLIDENKLLKEWSYIKDKFDDGDIDYDELIKFVEIKIFGKVVDEELKKYLDNK